MIITAPTSPSSSRIHIKHPSSTSGPYLPPEWARDLIASWFTEKDWENLVKRMMRYTGKLLYQHKNFRSLPLPVRNELAHDFTYETLKAYFLGEIAWLVPQEHCRIIHDDKIFDEAARFFAKAIERKVQNANRAGFYKYVLTGKQDTGIRLALENARGSFPSPDQNVQYDSEREAILSKFTHPLDRKIVKFILDYDARKVGHKLSLALVSVMLGIPKAKLYRRISHIKRRLDS